MFLTCKSLAYIKLPRILLPVSRIFKNKEMVVGFGTLFILSGPSGIGKNTVASKLLAAVGKAHLRKVITTTTRPPRNSEVDGVDYNFVSKEKFLEKTANGDFLEFALVHGEHYYGSPLADIKSILSSKSNALLLIDTTGVEQILQRKNDFRIVTIFIMPEDLNDLKQRIAGRGTETVAEIEKRLKSCEIEIQKSQLYDHVITSGSPEDDLAAVLTIYNDEVQRQLTLDLSRQSQSPEC
jgi:guanylate kinase